MSTRPAHVSTPVAQVQVIEDEVVALEPLAPEPTVSDVQPLAEAETVAAPEVAPEPELKQPEDFGPLADAAQALMANAQTGVSLQPVVDAASQMMDAADHGVQQIPVEAEVRVADGPHFDEEPAPAPEVLPDKPITERLKIPAEEASEQPVIEDEPRPPVVAEILLADEPPRPTRRVKTMPRGLKAAVPKSAAPEPDTSALASLPVASEPPSKTPTLDFAAPPVDGDAGDRGDALFDLPVQMNPQDEVAPTLLMSVGGAEVVAEDVNASAQDMSPQTFAQGTEMLAGTESTEPDLSGDLPAEMGASDESVADVDDTQIIAEGDSPSDEDQVGAVEPSGEADEDSSPEAEAQGDDEMPLSGEPTRVGESFADALPGVYEDDRTELFSDADRREIEAQAFGPLSDEESLSADSSPDLSPVAEAQGEAAAVEESEFFNAETRLEIPVVTADMLAALRAQEAAERAALAAAADGSSSNDDGLDELDKPDLSKTKKGWWPFKKKDKK